MRLLTAVRPDGERIGLLWIGFTHPRGLPDCGFGANARAIRLYESSDYEVLTLQMRKRASAEDGSHSPPMSSW